MKNIIVKVKTDNNIVEIVNVTTKDNIVTRVKGRASVVYDLCSSHSHSPDHLITKRVHQDLHVFLEENGENADLVIENYFTFPESYLIGQAGNGQYYHYIPDTGEQFDYVNNLASGELEGHALGGDVLVNSWWSGQDGVEKADFNPLLLVSPVILATAVTLALNDDSKNKNNVKVDTLGHEVVIDFDKIETVVLEKSEMIQLSLTDVLTITESDDLLIDGDDSNFIKLSGFNELSSTSSDTQNGYNLYVSNDVSIYIDQDIHIL